MKNNHSYDLIGDIHGQHDKLVVLLEKLGYQPHGTLGYRHPEGRRVIFLGDYIDRGPKIREVLHTVRAMVEAGDALAIMGNHEYNAVCYHTPDGKGCRLRADSPDKLKQHIVTLSAFEGREDEWRGWLEWFKGLPFFLELDGLRAVHACWDAKRIKRLDGMSLLDDAFLRASAASETPEHRAVENVLKGPEIDLPDGCWFHDKEGIARRRVRARWWEIRDGLRARDVAMPLGGLDLDVEIEGWRLRNLPNYGADEVPVFFGHYWFPAEASKAPIRGNLACLDFSGGLHGPLVAYRWNGERVLSADNFFSHQSCN